MTVALQNSVRRRDAVALLAGRTLLSRRRMIASLATAGFALAMMTTALYSSIGADYDELLADMPEAMVSMLGDADLGTPEGWLQVELFSIVGPGLAIGAGVALGSGSVAGDEQAGRLTLVTSGPTRRSSVIVAGAGSTIVAVSAVSTGLLGGVVAGAVVSDFAMPWVNLVAACVSLAFLGAATGMISLAAGAVTGRRGTAVAFGTGVGLVSYAVDAFFPLSSTLDPLSKISLWHPYSANQPLVNGLAGSHIAILAMIAVAATVVAVIGFERRDLGG